jgi:hypothetical protein
MQVGLGVLAGAPPMFGDDTDEGRADGVAHRL